MTSGGLSRMDVQALFGGLRILLPFIRSTSSSLDAVLSSARAISAGALGRSPNVFLKAAED
eukprot:CAMPEP_0177530348 /NCGR_PEP_ID=MMETSP0369-20130122/53345_1 /TAXON_ID=447022 ORGANISM="Scrippsiella hangoei-like, Strain SHHI-4" /NCGR_SAMPLE_ID=MMETSP0369 /ASSEMBLY_ACC=CAM_ASM_000364 /LENGTH=60 /DNA_ID=CAMNT_0019011185 /DNA_START=9 /DNA_END=188 /DNA_ORIENTATION=-